MRLHLLTALILTGTCAVAEPPPVPTTARLEVVLDGAVWPGEPGSDPTKPQPLSLRLARNHGRWERVVGAAARSANKTDQHGRALELAIDDRQAKVSVTLQEEPAPWDPPRDWNRYQVTLTRAADGTYTGTWMGAYHGQAGQGKAVGTVLPVTEAPGAVPAADERPRLLFRKRDLPALKAKAATPWGQREVQRLRAVAQGRGGPGTEGPTARAMALGLLYQLTGEKALADQGRKLLLADLPNWYNVSQVHGAAACVSQGTMAYDLLAETGDPAWRAAMQGMLRVKMNYLYYPPSGGFNDNDGSNWSGMFRSAMGMAALGLLADGPAPDQKPLEAPAITALPAMADLPVEGMVVTALEPGKAIGTWLHAGPFDVERDTPVLATIGGAAARPKTGMVVTYTNRAGASASCTFAPLPATCRISKEMADKYRLPALEGGLDYAAVSGRKYLTTHLLSTVLEVAQAGTYQIQHYSKKIDRLGLHLDGRTVTSGQVVQLAAGRHLLVMEAAIGVCGNWEFMESYLRFQPLTPAEAGAWLATAKREYEHVQAVRAIDREENADTEARRWLAVAELRQSNFADIAFGDAGWNGEGEAYTQHALRTALCFEHAFLNATGRRLSASANLPATFSLYVAKTVFRADGADMPSYGPGGGPLGVDNWARGFALVEPRYREVCRQAWDRTTALAETGKFQNPTALISDLDACSAAFRFVNHPGTEPATVDVAGVVPRVLVDRRKGGFVFRNAWKDDDDSVATLLIDHAKIQAGWNGPDYGDIRWYALGTVWAERGIPWGNGINLRRAEKDGTYPDLRQFGSVVSVPGCKIAQAGTPAPKTGRAALIAANVAADGSGVVDVDLSGCYVGAVEVEVPGQTKKKSEVKDLGIRARRSVAVDYSGAAGVPALMAVADRLTGTKGDETWQFCTAAEHKITTDATGFTITAANGATLRGTVVAPAIPTITVVSAKFSHEANYHGSHDQVWLTRQVIRVQGAGSLFVVVMTVQKGAAPAVAVDGTKAKVGAQTIAWDGTTLKLEKLAATSAIQAP
jgi:hypothetical protein